VRQKTTFCASHVAACETSRLVTLSLAVVDRETRSQLRRRQTLPTNMRPTVSFNTRAAALVKSNVSQGSGRIDDVRDMRNCPRLSRASSSKPFLVRVKQFLQLVSATPLHLGDVLDSRGRPGMGPLLYSMRMALEQQYCKRYSPNIILEARQ
jgi:hypothetical protein